MIKRYWSMLPRAIAGVLVLSLAVLSTAVAQESAGREADHEALRALARNVTDAMNAQDLEALFASLSDDFVYTSSDQTRITSRKEFEDYYHGLFKAPDALLKSILVKPEALTKTMFLSENVGYCYGSADETYTTSDDRIADFKSHWTATVVREGGEWKLATVHIGINFLDNVYVSRISGSIAKWAGLMAIAGLVLGFVLGRATRRKG